MKANLFTSRFMTMVFVLSLLVLNVSPVSAATVQITSLSTATLARSGRLHIFGTGFGTNGQVLVMAMNWGNEGNRQRLLDGFVW